MKTSIFRLFRQNQSNQVQTPQPSFLHLPLHHLPHLPSWMCDMWQNNIQQLQ